MAKKRAKASGSGTGAGSRKRGRSATRSKASPKGPGRKKTKTKGKVGPAETETAKAEGAGEKAKPRDPAPNVVTKEADAAKAKALTQMRRQIDRMDKRLIELLNKRAELVVQVGRYKVGSGSPIYAPHRERDVLERVLGANQGPLSDRAVEAVYRELMSGSFALERPLEIGYLGPQGSWSHVAATRQFGSSVEYEDLHTIGGVFTEVRRGHVDYGLVPIENSLGGGVAETLDAFLDNAREVFVYAEAQIEIHHSLLTNVEPKQIRRIHSKPEVFDQCRTWLATQFPRAELVPAPSTSGAARTVAEETEQAERIGATPGSAAIGSSLAGQIYGLRTLFEDIEDRPGNITRFLVLSGHETRRSGDDKTSIMFQTADKPGALVRVLSVFDRFGINLTHIDKRPSRATNWTYTFFVDAQGHRDDPEMAEALELVEAHCREVVVLGSYPRSTRLL